MHLLLDNLLSQDATGVQTTLTTMWNELPQAVRSAAYPPPPATSSSVPAIDPNRVFQHLSLYLQTFPHQAAIASDNDGSLPLHFAASLGDVLLSRIVWQAVSGGC